MRAKRGKAGAGSLRIIAGSRRGMRLRTAPAGHLRPMLDRVREALFNIIRDDLPGAKVLDLYCGTGALGLEALSRGAERCVFVEADHALAELTRHNAARCGLSEQCLVLEADVLALPAREAPALWVPAQVVFVDPPYADVDDPGRRDALFQALEAMAGAWFDRGAVLVLHHRPMRYALWPTEVLREVDKRVYGRSQLTFFTAGDTAP